MASMRRVHAREDDYRQADGPDRFTDLCQRLVVQETGRQLRDRVRRSRSDHVAVHFRVRSRFSRQSCLVTYGQTRQLLQLLDFTAHAQPMPRSRRQRHRHLPPTFHRRLNEAGAQLLHSAGR
ncbi:hypothetical protein SNA_15180 [Streptomyces natalensis ATCC 27448]|uniref:Uncharacterized protein n=1 Tax=Streptomyces natalensis ATCC 27448 TaxID=1240678 RepID=A0A0D7CPM4_9ACTN|nr:hypothetical protein SNA_15180 [Streptomyces natalensis ATCC 27448]